MNRTILGAALAAGLAAWSAQAAVIDFDEAVDGDLPNYNDPPRLFTLDSAGVNRWRGSSTTPTATSTYELDHFAIDIAPGLLVSAYTLDISNLTELPGSSPGARIATTRITARDLIARYATLEYDDITGTRTETNPIPLPWGPADALAVRTSYGRGSDTYYTWDWEVTLTTTPAAVVPLPATLPLLTGALALGAALSHRARSRMTGGA